MKHTKGPWKIENHLNAVGPYTSARLEVWSNNRHIATINEHVDDIKIDKANANLISAAPDMFKILEKLMNEPELPEHIVNYLYPIFKKAKGN